VKEPVVVKQQRKRSREEDEEKVGRPPKHWLILC
jgi:hypothetical protein